MIHLANKIASVIDQGQVSAGVFLNLSKEFDTLDHNIFLNQNIMAPAAWPWTGLGGIFQNVNSLSSLKKVAAP